MQFSLYTVFKPGPMLTLEMAENPDAHKACGIYTSAIVNNGIDKATRTVSDVCFIDYEREERTHIIKNNVEELDESVQFFADIITETRKYLPDSAATMYGIPLFIDGVPFHTYGAFANLSNIYCSPGLYWNREKGLPFLIEKTKQLYKDLTMVKYNKAVISKHHPDGGYMSDKDFAKYLKNILLIIHNRTTLAVDAGFNQSKIDILWWDNRLRSANTDDQIYAVETQQIADFKKILHIMRSFNG